MPLLILSVYTYLILIEIARLLIQKPIKISFPFDLLKGKGWCGEWAILAEDSLDQPTLKPSSDMTQSIPEEQVGWHKHSWITKNA